MQRRPPDPSVYVQLGVAVRALELITEALVSTEASEIVTSMTTALKQHLVELHNQNINDVQVIVSRLETRMLEEFTGVKERLAVVEAALGITRSAGPVPVPVPVAVPPQESRE